MSRHSALFPTGGRSAAVGFRSATMACAGEAPSSSKSPDSLPNGRRDGKSRLVQVRPYRKGIRVGDHRPLVEVHQGEIHVGAVVVFSSRWAARGQPVCLPSLAGIAVTVGVERIEANWLRRVRPHADHFVDREDFPARLPGGDRE